MGNQPLFNIKNEAKDDPLAFLYTTVLTASLKELLLPMNIKPAEKDPLALLSHHFQTPDAIEEKK